MKFNRIFKRAKGAKCHRMRPLRLPRVEGFEGRFNDILFQAAALRAKPQETLVYFGGDVQDYPEVMQAHRDNKHYLKWNLENTVTMLGHNFPTKHIIAVRPARIEFKSFSCYDNFVPSSNAGVPEHTPTHNALQHLERLLEGVSERIKSLPISQLESLSTPQDEHMDAEDCQSGPEESGVAPREPPGGPSAGPALTQPKPAAAKPWWEWLCVEQSRLALAGFSKGCVALNQMLYEFHYISTLTPSDATALRFIERIEDMFWLDGGHAGGRGTWVTARGLLETLSRLDINIHVHVSPYQVLDESRPWIGREEKAFTGMLKKLGAKVSRHLHGCATSPHSLHMHFDVLGSFHRAPPRHPRRPSTSDEDEDDI